MDLRIAEISTHFVKKPRKTSIPNEMKPSRIKGLGCKEGVFHSNRDWRTHSGLQTERVAVLTYRRQCVIHNLT